MVAIIACHYVVHGGCFSLCTRYNFIVGQLFSLGGNIGVICFCILAGYFLPIFHFSFKKAFILIGEVCFYAWLWLLFAYIFHADTVNANLVTSIFPVFTGAYWFATAYIGAYILSPFLIKTCLQKSPEQPINQNRVIITVLILGFLLYVRPPYFILPVSAYYSDLFWFVFLFFVGTYLRMNPPQWFAKPNICMLLFVCPLFIMWGLLILFHYLIISNPNIGQYTSYITGRTSILGLCSSLGLFGLFKNMQIRKSPIINYINLTILHRLPSVSIYSMIPCLETFFGIPYSRLKIITAQTL